MKTNWATAPLGRVVEFNARTLPETTDPSFEFRYIDIGSVGRGALIEEPQTLTFENSPSRARRILRPGDTIVSTVRTYLRAVMRVPGDATNLVGSTGFAVLTARPQLDSRFLSWFSQSDPFIEEVVAQSVGVSYPAISPSDLARLPVPTPNLPTQRAIADFLDTETARIDALIAKKRRMLSLLDELDLREIDECFAPRDGESLVRLARFASIQTGVTLHEGRVLDGDVVTWPYLRVANVQPGWLDLSEVKSVTLPKLMASRSTLRTGDVLMTEGGDRDKLGRGTVWRGEIPDCLHQNHVFAVRPDLLSLDSEYLGYLTRTSHARAYFEMTAVQSTNLASTSASKVADFSIPALPIGEQRSRVEWYQRFAAKNRRISAALTKQLDLIAEHRQALITAAVTGQIEVTGAAAS